jgi:hypothetical protein
MVDRLGRHHELAFAKIDTVKDLLRALPGRMEP